MCDAHGTWSLRPCRAAQHVSMTAATRAQALHLPRRCVYCGLQGGLRYPCHASSLCIIFSNQYDRSPHETSAHRISPVTRAGSGCGSAGVTLTGVALHLCTISHWSLCTMIVDPVDPTFEFTILKRSRFTSGSNVEDGLSALGALFRYFVPGGGPAPTLDLPCPMTLPCISCIWQLIVLPSWRCGHRQREDATTVCTVQLRDAAERGAAGLDTGQRPPSRALTQARRRGAARRR